MSPTLSIDFGKHLAKLTDQMLVFAILAAILLGIVGERLKEDNNGWAASAVFISIPLILLVALVGHLYLKLRLIPSPEAGDFAAATHDKVKEHKWRQRQLREFLRAEGKEPTDDR